MSVTAVTTACPINALQPIQQKAQRAISFPDPILSNVRNTAWERFKDCFLTKSKLRRAVEELQQGNLSTHWDANLQTISKAFQSTDYHILRPQLRKILKRLDAEQLKQLFDRLISSEIKGKNRCAIINCLKLMTADELGQVFQSAISRSGITAKKAAQSLSLAIQQHRKMMEQITPNKNQTARCFVIHLLQSIIDTLLLAFSFFEIGREPASSWDAFNLLQTYGKILAAPLILFTGLLTIYTPLNALFVTAAIVSCLAIALFVYVKWFKPCPEHIDPCTNLTAQAAKGNLQPVLGRDAEIDQILNCLAASTKQNRSHPFLCGPAGVGKDEIAKGIAQRLVIGNVPPCLRGKKLFIVNTAELFDTASFQAQDKLRRMLNRFRTYKNDVIVFFNELQSAKQKNNELAERLKSVFDTHPEDGLPYCIAATTEEDYNKHFANDPTYVRRFQKIAIESLDDDDQILLVLREAARHQAPDLDISDESLKKIRDQAKDNMNHLPQPLASTRLLAKAINVLRSKQNNQYVSKELQEKRATLANLSSILHHTPTMASQHADEMSQLQEDIAALKEEQVQNQKLFTVFQQIKSYKIRQSKALFAAAEHYSEEENKKLFLFLNYYLLPYVKEKIEHLKNSNFSFEIDDAIIQQILNEEAKESGSSG